MQVGWKNEVPASTGEEEHGTYYMGTFPGSMGTMYYGGKKESLR